MSNQISSTKPPICDYIPLMPGCNPVTSPNGPLNPTNPNSPINPTNAANTVANTVLAGLFQQLAPVLSRVGLFLLAAIVIIVGFFVLSAGGQQ